MNREKQASWVPTVLSLSASWLDVKLPYPSAPMPSLPRWTVAPKTTNQNSPFFLKPLLSSRVRMHDVEVGGHLRGTGILSFHLYAGSSCRDIWLGLQTLSQVAFARNFVIATRKVTVGTVPRSRKGHYFCLYAGLKMSCGLFKNQIWTFKSYIIYNRPITWPSNKPYSVLYTSSEKSHL